MYTYLCMYVYTHECIYHFQCVFIFQDFKEFIVYVFISNTPSLAGYYHGNILSDYYLIRLFYSYCTVI